MMSYQPTRYKHVLAAVDTTDDAKEVLGAAQQLSNDHGATLSFVTVVKPVKQVYGAIDAARVASFEQEAVTEARERLQEHARTFGVDNDRVFVLRGHPATEIRELAKELDVGAIIIGTHGRHGMGLMFLGSTARGVLHGIDCDVIAIRIPEAA
jgi:universal stress protein A